MRANQPARCPMVRLVRRVNLLGLRSGARRTVLARRRNGSSEAVTTEEHKHRFEVAPAVLTPNRQYEGRCACGAVKAYPLTPVAPGKAASVARSPVGMSPRAPLGAESGKRGAAATKDVNRRQRRYRTRKGE